MHIQPCSESAQQKAHALLKALLTHAEYWQLSGCGYLDVSSPSDPQVRYRIPREPGFVRVYRSGKPVMDLCVQPTEPLPQDDVVLMHKLMIQGDEAAYIATAIRYPTWPMEIPTLREMVRWLGGSEQEP